MMEDRKACGLGNVDLTVVGIPAASAGAMMQEIIDLNATKAVFVMSGGFSETEAGKESEDGLKRSLAAFGNDTERRMIINGPNTVGYKFSFDVPDADTIDRLKAEGTISMRSDWSIFTTLPPISRSTPFSLLLTSLLALSKMDAATVR